MHILSLTNIVASDSAEVGGKARNAARLIQAGFPVPPGWVIPTDLFQAQLAAWGITSDTSETTIISKLQHNEFTPELLSALAALPDIPFAVRSSAAVEDGAAASYSGIFDSVLGVQGLSSLEEAVRRVWLSAFTPEALAYHRRVSGTNGYPSMAVLLMPMVDALAAGVAFSAHPVDGNPFVIAISANYGLGTTVVDGQLPVDRYLLDWDTLAVKEQELGSKPAGEFLIDGKIEKREIDSIMQEQAVLDEKTLVEIGRLVREIDRLFDKRIDVEFAVTPQGVMLLQARPIVGLPPYFPEDPRTQDPEIICSHQECLGPLSPYARASFEATMNSTFPRPPWPMEVGKFIFQHGRAFLEFDKDPEVIENPEEPWHDRGFIKRMMPFDDPELIFNEWYQYADMIYGQIIPSLRAFSERILRIPYDELRTFRQDELTEQVQIAIQLDVEAVTLYLAASYPTYETLRRIDILIRDGLRLDWQEAQQLALTMIQGAPKLTHLRDSEIEEAARTGHTDDAIAHWGYSYLRRDDLLDISTWRSWLEDATPLHLAITNLRKASSARSIPERIQRAMEESDTRFQEVTESIRASALGGERLADIFIACVRASRRLFPLKDDRDLVMSHAQSAVRWVLCEAGRRFLEAGIISEENDIFLLYPEEIVECVSGKFDLHEIEILIQQRREEQERFARYTLPEASSQSDETCKDGDVLQGKPANAGIAEGPVRIITTDNFNEVEQLQPGEILWLRGEGKVGWTMYFPLIAGLIYNGNWLCHETNICRELGIPAVIGIRNISSIRTGDLVRIDGGKGMIYRLPKT